MASFLVTEVAFFSTLLVAYVVYIGKSKDGPMPAEVLSLTIPILGSICLLSSSVTIHLATGRLHHGDASGFRKWWLLTIVLGILFLLGTGYEWKELIYEHGLTISRNLFGTTYFTLVGFHAAHVTIGVVLMFSLFSATLGYLPPTQLAYSAELLSWYWHFVDCVWVVVFIVVYVLSRLPA